MAKLVLTLPALYKDNSLNKEALKKKKISTKFVQLENQLEKVEKKRKIFASLVKIEDEKQDLINKIKQEIQSKALSIEKMNSAANFIQQKAKHFKLMQQLRKNEETALQETLALNLIEINNSVSYIFWNLGNAAYDSSNKIKKAYKRSKFRAKIERIKKIYKILTKNKKTVARHFLRKSLSVFISKLKIENYLNDLKEKVHRAKIAEIRKNLALEAIKRFWKMNHITFRKYMFKCKKFKHLLERKKLTNFLSVDYGLQSGIGSYLSTPKNELSDLAVIQNQEIARAAAERLLKEKQEKLSFSLISYNVRKPKRKIVNPLNIVLSEDRSMIVKNNLIRRRESGIIGNSSKTIGYSNQNTGLSNGSLTTRSASHKRRVIRF